MQYKLLSMSRRIIAESFVATNSIPERPALHRLGLIVRHLAALHSLRVRFWPSEEARILVCEPVCGLFGTRPEGAGKTGLGTF